MPGLIDDLKTEHRAIGEALEQMKKLGSASATGKERIIAVRGALLSHLKKEDERLYPPLLKDAQSDNSLRIKLNMMADDMKKVTGAANEFFAKYQDGGQGLEFIKDFGALTGKLNIRILWEEAHLYPEYERRYPA
jgi:iron-sulfur cluster repair protein YtfE (RIC family)